MGYAIPMLGSKCPVWRSNCAHAPSLLHPCRLAGSFTCSNLGSGIAWHASCSPLGSRASALFMFKAASVFLNYSRTGLFALLVAVAGGPSYVAASVPPPFAPLGIERLPNGNTLISDYGSLTSLPGGRVLELDGLGRLVWAYVGCDVPSLHTARRLANGNTLMSSSVGDKVVEVDPDGNAVWTFASGPTYPNEAYRLANGNTLITERDDNRVIEVTSAGSIVWDYSNLNGPHNGNRLANGHTLISDSNNDRVVEVDSAGNVVWQYATGLSWPRCAERLGNGNTLIADTRHNRVIEVDSSGAIVWGVNNLPQPFAAVRLGSGNTLVSVADRVVELTRSDSVVWQYPNTVPVKVETLHVVNPSSSCVLYVHIHRPAYAGPNYRVPGLIFVPGGTGYGSEFDAVGLPDQIASDGFALLHFDPDGRGLSGVYAANYDGYVHQDGMYACLLALASRAYVDTSRLGVYSQRFGITMASGMIARHPSPRVKFLLDFEGPADRYQTCLDSGGFVPVPPDSDAFWQEREAGRFMKQVPGAYLRMQPVTDSNPRLWDNRHAIQLIDSATAVTYGGAGVGDWTRTNDPGMNPVNRVYTLLHPPVWIPDVQEVEDYTRVLLYLHELADLDLSGTAVDERPVARSTAPLRLMPRPCRGALQVMLPSGQGERDLLVHDVCGRLVARTVVPAERQQAVLDVRVLQPGVYYLTAAGAGTVPFTVVR
jgi:hypothetical protein